MTNNFDLRKFLSENKITRASNIVAEERYSDYYESEAAKKAGASLELVINANAPSANIDADVATAIAKAEEETGTEVSPREKRVLSRQAHWIYTMRSEMERESVESYDEEVIDEEVSEEIGEAKANLKASKLSSEEYQKAKKLKDFKSSDWKWNSEEDLYDKVEEKTVNESREAYLTRLVENALGITPAPVAEESNDEMVEENPLPKYKNIDELMKNIESGTNEAAHKYKMNRMKEIADALESKVTSLEEGENAEHIDQKAVKAMKKDIMTLRKGVDKLEKEYEKKFAKKEKKEDK